MIRENEHMTNDELSNADQMDSAPTNVSGNGRIDAELGELTIRLSPEEQLTFWQALETPVVLTPAQQKLGELMRSLAAQRCQD